MLRQTKFTPEEWKYLNDTYNIKLLHEGNEFGFDHPEKMPNDTSVFEHMQAGYKALLRDKVNEGSQIPKEQALSNLNALLSEEDGFQFDSDELQDGVYHHILELIKKFLETQLSDDWYSCVNFVVSQ